MSRPPLAVRQTFRWAAYQSASGCTRYGPAGCNALATYLEDRFSRQFSMGICVCRSLFGGAGWSHHAECRAYDMGYPASTLIGTAVLRLLGPYGSRLGIDHMIVNFNPTSKYRGDPWIFSAATPAGKVYTGAHPHKDHNHIGLTRNAGRYLTYATLVSVLGRPTPAPTPPPPTDDWTTGVIMALPTLKRGATGAPVKRAQGLLLANGFKDRNTSTPETATDGIFGTGTEAAAKAFQKSRGLTVDGIIGRGTWTKLLGQ